MPLQSCSASRERACTGRGGRGRRRGRGVCCSRGAYTRTGTAAKWRSSWNGRWHVRAAVLWPCVCRACRRRWAEAPSCCVVCRSSLGPATLPSCSPLVATRCRCIERCACVLCGGKRVKPRSRRPTERSFGCRCCAPPCSSCGATSAVTRGATSYAIAHARSLKPPGMKGGVELWCPLWSTESPCVLPRQAFEERGGGEPPAAYWPRLFRANSGEGV